jgi:hypothetical protein
MGAVNARANKSPCSRWPGGRAAKAGLWPPAPIGPETGYPRNTTKGGPVVVLLGYGIRSYALLLSAARCRTERCAIYSAHRPRAPSRWTCSWTVDCGLQDHRSQFAGVRSARIAYCIGIGRGRSEMAHRDLDRRAHDRSPTRAAAPIPPATKKRREPIITNNSDFGAFRF